MNNGGYKILIVEGDDREINVLNSVVNFFFPQKKVKFISLPAGENIYMLTSNKFLLLQIKNKPTTIDFC